MSAVSSSRQCAAVPKRVSSVPALSDRIGVTVSPRSMSACITGMTLAKVQNEPVKYKANAKFAHKMPSSCRMVSTVSNTARAALSGATLPGRESACSAAAIRK